MNRELRQPRERGKYAAPTELWIFGCGRTTTMSRLRRSTNRRVQIFSNRAKAASKTALMAVRKDFPVGETWDAMYAHLFRKIFAGVRAANQIFSIEIISRPASEVIANLQMCLSFLIQAARRADISEDWLLRLFHSSC